MLLPLAIVLMAGWLGYYLLFPSAQLAPLVVRQVEGTVLQIDANGARIEAVPGAVLKREDKIETEDDGRALLAFGTDSTLALHHGTTMTVLGLSKEGLKVELDEGRVEATVRPGRGTLGIVNLNREIIATDATFTVGVNRAGGLAVESQRGQVELSGVEGFQVLREGQRIMASRDGTARLASIPESLLLEVEWPDSAATREAELSVAGRTDPGAMVRIGASGKWTAVMAGADGRFKATVPLAEGPNALEVISQDPLGRTTSQDSSIIRDSRPPQGTLFEVHY